MAPGVLIGWDSDLPRPPNTCPLPVRLWLLTFLLFSKLISLPCKADSQRPLESVPSPTTTRSPVLRMHYPGKTPGGSGAQSRTWVGSGRWPEALGLGTAGETEALGRRAQPLSTHSHRLREGL